MKARAIKAWAVVDKKNPKIDVMDIFKDKDIKCAKSEKIIRVEIKESK